nr:uncharacterized protein LOC107128683 isoform X1 [Macaca fascicularis]XP_045245780.1 uncharacterized protein LOC107128683 isoform X1 [Macaca fascicularis]
MPGRQRGPQAPVLCASRRRWLPGPVSSAGNPSTVSAQGNPCAVTPTPEDPLGDEGTKEEEENPEQGLGGKWRREGLREARPRGSSRTSSWPRDWLGAWSDCSWVSRGRNSPRHEGHFYNHPFGAAVPDIGIWDPDTIDRTESSKTALMLAVHYDPPGIVNILLKQNVKSSTQDMCG